MNKFVQRLKKRILPFFDMTAWILLLVCMIPLYLLDKAMLFTLLQWSAYGLALAANSIVLCRLLIPQVNLSEWIKSAGNGSMPCAVVVASIIFLLASLFLGLVIWAKA